MVLFEKIKNFGYVLRSLNEILTPRQKRLSIINFLLSLLGSLLQMLGVSIILPIVSLMTDPAGMWENPYVAWICGTLHIESGDTLFLLLIVGTIILYIVKNAYCIFLSWFNVKYANMVSRELSMRMMRYYMQRPYDFFLKNSSQEIYRDVENDPASINRLINSLFNIISELLTILMIVGYIVVMDWRIACCIVLIAVICLVVIYAFFRREVKKQGIIQREMSAAHQKSFYQAIEGIKEVQVMRRQEYFLDFYQDTWLRSQHANVIMQIASTSPTYVVEGLFVAGIMAYIGFRSFADPNFQSMVPLLSSFALGAIRMLPSLGRISSGLNSMTFSVPSLNSMRENLRQIKEEAQDDAHLAHPVQPAGMKEGFEKALALSEVTWRYAGADHDVLRNLDLLVRKGESIGIVGASGAGKSTLADIILGLHIPQAGSVTIDGVDVYSIPDDYAGIIGYVPQSVYLVDGSIRENVAFGEDPSDIREEDIWASLEQAQLAEHVRSLPEGLDTIVGERGMRFSGGQRQRLAIARALYRKPQILILDEATSALDNETEAAVMDAIEHLYGTITMIIIAHRLTTVAKCDAVYEIRDGKAVRTEVPRNP